MGVLPKRLSHAYHYDDRLQGSIHCEILVLERGSWVALPIYRMESQAAGSKTVLSGFIESSSNRRFRVILSYTKGSSRPSHWLLDHDIVCALHFDGRIRPISEHAIRQGTFENPLDLAATSEASELAALHPHIPKEQDQPFCWQARSDKYPQLTTLPKCATSIDELSSIKLELSRCKLQKIKRGVSVFPSSVPREMSTRADRQFEVLRKRHADLPHEILVDDTPEDKVSKQEVVSDFEYSSDPFVEFKLFYKDGPTLERLGIKPTDALPSRRRGGTRCGTSAPAVKSETPAWMPEGPSTVAEQRAAFARMQEALRKPVAEQLVTKPVNPQITPAKRSAPPSIFKPPKSVSFTSVSPAKARASASSVDGPRKRLAKRNSRCDGPHASSSRLVYSSKGSSSSTDPSKRLRLQDSSEKQKPSIVERSRPPAAPSLARKTGSTSSLPTSGDPESYSALSSSKAARYHKLARRAPRDPRSPSPDTSNSYPMSTVQAPPTPPSMHSDSDNHALPNIDSDNESLPSISDLIRGRKPAMPKARVSVDSGAPAWNSSQANRTSVREEALVPASNRPTLLPKFRKAMSTTTDIDSDMGLDAPPPNPAPLAGPAMAIPAQDMAAKSHAHQASGPVADPGGRPLSPSHTLPIEQKPRIPPTPSSISTRAKKPLTMIDLTLDSEEEEDKKVVPIPASTPIVSTSGGAGVERNAKARQEAKDFLESLGILDDMNVEDLLGAGFKSRNTFAPRLKCCAEEDRNALLGDLRQSMGRIDYSILAGFLRGQGIEC